MSECAAGKPNINRPDLKTPKIILIVAHDEAGQVRAFRLKSQPFFIGTLFQPERRALAGSLHPIVRTFFLAAS